jgi:hypothetical protein
VLKVKLIREEAYAIILVLQFAPLGLATLCFRQGACTGPPPLSTSIKVALPLLLDHLPLQSFPNTPSLGRLISSCAVDPYLHRPTPNDHFVSLAAAENDGTACLKPESSISYSGFNALECLRRRSFLLSQLD